MIHSDNLPQRNLRILVTVYSLIAFLAGTLGFPARTAAQPPIPEVELEIADSPAQITRINLQLPDSLDLPWDEIQAEIGIGRDNYFIYPVFQVKDAKLRLKDRPDESLFGSTRRATLPPGIKESDEPVLAVSVIDFLNRANYVGAVEAGVFANVKSGRKPIAKPRPAVPVGERLPNLSVALVVEKPGGVLKIISRYTFTPGGQVEPEFTFPLQPDQLTHLRNVAAGKLSLVIEGDYVGRVINTHFEATLGIISERLSNALSTLLTKPGEKQQPLLFLSVGGEGTNTTSFTSLLRESVEIEIQKRKGKAVDSALLDRIIDKLLETSKSALAEYRNQDDKIVSSILGNQLRVTASIGQLKKVANNDVQNHEAAFEASMRELIEGEKDQYKAGNLVIDVLDVVKVGVGGQTADKKSTKEERENAAKLATKQFLDLGKALEGDIPYVTAFSLDQIQRMSRESNIRTVIKFSEFQAATRKHAAVLSFNTIPTTRTMKTTITLIGPDARADDGNDAGNTFKIAPGDTLTLRGAQSVKVFNDGPAKSEFLGLLTGKKVVRQLVPIGSKPYISIKEINSGRDIRITVDRSAKVTYRDTFEVKLVVVDHD